MYPFKKKIYPFILSAKFFSLLVILLKETDLFPHLLYQQKKNWKKQEHICIQKWPANSKLRQKQDGRDT